MFFTKRILFVFAFLLGASVVWAQKLDTAKIDEALGRSGQKIGEVYKVGFPRTDLHVTVQGVEIKPALALGSWAAFAGSDDAATVMGDLVLQQSEVDGVMESLRASGFEITALHNHLLDETPRIIYMHYMGRGQAAKLAESLHSALEHSKTPLGKPAAAVATPPALPASMETVQKALDRKGAWNGSVLSYGVPRAEPITMDGMTIAPSQGVAESINFQEAVGERVATTGDFVLTAEEVNPVITALRGHQIRVTAVHSHMLTEQPRLFFVHFWGLGAPVAVAEGIREALGHVHVK